IWVTRLFDTSRTVTGMDSPSSVKMRVMPTLRPTRPSRCAPGVDVVFDIVFSIPDCDWSVLIGPENSSRPTYSGNQRKATTNHRPRLLLPKRQAGHHTMLQTKIARLSLRARLAGHVGVGPRVPGATRHAQCMRHPAKQNGRTREGRPFTVRYRREPQVRA